MSESNQEYFVQDFTGDEGKLPTVVHLCDTEALLSWMSIHSPANYKYTVFKAECLLDWS